jgi:hypothetical protein
MKPLAMLIGIVMGSAVSITVALALTLVVFLFLPEYAPRIGEEFPPLLRALAGAALLALVSGASFYGEVRSARWRWAPQTALALLLVLIGWIMWPAETA